MAGVHLDKSRKKQAYIVRFKRRTVDGKSCFTVINVATTRRHDFPELADLFRYFEQQMGESSANRRDPPGG